MSEHCQMPEGHPTHCGCQQPDRYQSADYCKAIESERDYLRQRVKALHAEAEALRSENGRLRADHGVVAHAHLLRAQIAERELEEARGLLRECRNTVSLAHDLAETEVEGEKYSALGRRITTFLSTATLAPEAQAEQGERQEAVARVAIVPGTDFKSLDFFNTDLQELPVGAMLYTTPQPGPDVRGLVEALEQIQRWDGFPSTGRFWEGSGKPMSYSACYGTNGERDFMRNVAATAIAAHRQAQRK